MGRFVCRPYTNATINHLTGTSPAAHSRWQLNIGIGTLSVSRAVLAVTRLRIRGTCMTTWQLPCVAALRCWRRGLVLRKAAHSTHDPIAIRLNQLAGVRGPPSR